MNKEKAQLKLMAEFGCWPTWIESSPYNVDPAALLISSDLRDALYAWEKQYDDTLKPDDPAASCFSSQDAEEAFKAEGAALLGRLKAELGDQFELTLCI